MESAARVGTWESCFVATEEDRAVLRPLIGSLLYLANGDIYPWHIEFSFPNLARAALRPGEPKETSELAAAAIRAAALDARGPKRRFVALHDRAWTEALIEREGFDLL